VRLRTNAERRQAIQAEPACLDELEPNADAPSVASFEPLSSIIRRADRRQTQATKSQRIVREWRSSGTSKAELEARISIAYARLEALPRCPDCGAKQRLRSARSRVFWGCPKFPRCRGSRSVNQAKFLAFTEPEVGTYPS
jgi:hypothetical protein